MQTESKNYSKLSDAQIHKNVQGKYAHAPEQDKCKNSGPIYTHPDTLVNAYF